jgi:cytochrome c553
VLAPAVALAADAAAGRHTALVCAACHGADGNSTTPLVPSLAAQPVDYTTLQLILFREKQRESAQMAPFAAGVSDTRAEDLATWFAGLALTPPASPPDETRAADGTRLAEANHCASCHLASYAGQNQIPRLAGQREDYLFKAMRDYRDGQRAGFDGTMTEVLHGMSDRDMLSLAHYLSHWR